uniref:Glycosyltransferase n=1 Tax=Linum usitatissimum TaxID=4006 RepID=I2BH67_LINUS|nr:UDP-glycosyltransferase 1 [Linum usitatissimum]
MAAAVTKEQRGPHIVVVTFAAHGHLNPTLHFSERLLLLGSRVTLVTTISGHSLLTNKKRSLPDGLSIATFSDGYDIPGSHKKSKDDQSKQWVQMSTRGAEFLNEFIATNSKEETPVCCLVYTLLLTWVADVARDNTLPSVLLWIQPATVFDIYYYLTNGFEEAFEKCKDPSFELELPGIPVSFTNDELPSFASPSNPHPFLRHAMIEQVKVLTRDNGKSKVLVNTFDELELKAINASDVKLEMIGVGPLIPSTLVNRVQYSIVKVSNGVFGINTVQEDKEKDCTLTWLDTQATSSVVFVSFGTMAVISRKQKEEIGKALLCNNRPFLWVIRKDEYEKEEELEEDRMELVRWREDIETKVTAVGGKIVEWCSQVDVLAHEAIGCFVTHCGWNSTLEGMCLGVPLVAFPQFSDQTTNAKLVEDMWKIGVRVVVGREKPVASDESEEEVTISTVVEGDEIRRCLDLVMGEGQVREQVRRNANKWKQLAMDALREGGSSESNLQAFVNEFTGK